MREVLHGDRVMVRVAGLDRRGRPEGKLVEVLERANTRIVGRVLVENGVTLVVPENRRISQEILLAPGVKAEGGGRAGGGGRARRAAHALRPAHRQGRRDPRQLRRSGHGDRDRAAQARAALRVSSAAKEQARRLPDKVRKMDWKGREDLTALPLVTIDGETARDFDDAVFCERQGRGFRLVVAIADVSHYVKVGSALDGEAYDRGNSVYFPRRVIPMLPEKLSNGLCSLNPQVERLCMVCDMAISRPARSSSSASIRR
jgi:ribonuclease R